MKKLLSFALVMVMLVGAVTLSGCNDMLEMYFHYLDIYENRVATTTITEEEWNAAKACNNFSTTWQVLDAEGNITTKGNAATNGTVMYQYAESESSVKDLYFTKIDDVAYQIIKEESGYVAYALDTLNVPVVGDLLADVAYSDLVYSEETGTYKYEGSDTVIEISFENGTMKNLTLTRPSANTTYNLFNFGTTVVELPEYTLGTPDIQ